ncbi:EP-cadherin-like [Pleurodeles waltl]|uniref:EP-cadherin-like n=1 Tax=Pleurodeles waltl TaxID=8319 RepID=UPI00370942D7
MEKRTASGEKTLPERSSARKSETLFHEIKQSIIMSCTAALLKPRIDLNEGYYHIYLRLFDNQNKERLTVVNATACVCSRSTRRCAGKGDTAFGLPIILAILVSVKGLLTLLFFLWLVKKPLLLAVDGPRNNLCHNGKAGRGVDDQGYKLNHLHRRLDSRPEILCNDDPTLMAAPPNDDPGEISNCIYVNE